MNSVTTFTSQELSLLQNMIGKRLDKYSCDPFEYSPTVYGIVGLYIDGVPYRLTSLHATVKRFFTDDAVAVFRLSQVSADEIKTFRDEGTLQETPVAAAITSIDIITDHQTVSCKNERQSLDYTVGLIFYLEDGRELSFEIKTWFSEMITVEKGYDLIEKFIPLEDFLEEWEDCDPYRGECSREIVTLK